MASSEKLHSEASLLKTRKASNDQKEIISCSLQNSCSILGKAIMLLKQGFINDIFPEMLRLFSAQLFHKILLNDSLGRMFICLVSQIIAATGQLSKCNG